MIRALIVLLMCAGTAAAQTSPGVVGEVRVHGNHTTPDADVLRLANVQVGQAFTPAILDDVASRRDIAQIAKEAPSSMR